MHKIILGGLVGVFVILVLAPLDTLAWEDCPLGLINDPYPGACPRYIDSNNDGICDHSQSEPSLPTSLTPESTSEIPSPFSPPPESPSIESPDLDGLSQLSSGRFRRLRLSELEELYHVPYQALLPLFQKYGYFFPPESTLAEVMNLSGWSRSQLLEELATLSLDQERVPREKSSSPTPLVAVAQSTPSSKGGTRASQETIVILLTIIFLTVLKSASLIRKRSHGRRLRCFTLSHYRKILNYALLFSFFISFSTGILDFFSLRWGWFQLWDKLIVDIHFDSSLIMVLIGAVHTFWHWPYYKTLLFRKPPRHNSARVKWLINIMLTASFLISALTGLLDLILVRYAGVNHFGQVLTAWHLYSSLIMIITGLAHALWHWRYYLRFTEQKKRNFEKNLDSRLFRGGENRSQLGADSSFKLSQIDEAGES